LLGTYSSSLVSLSVLIAVCASYVALDLAGRISVAQGRLRRLWIICGATVMGLGIWSMHYIGMLAFSLPIPVLYDLPTVMLSLFAAIFASGVALAVASEARLGMLRAAAGSLVMGLGVSTMHYVGMDAMRLRAVCHWNPTTVATSVLVAVLVSFVALILTFRFRADARDWSPLKLASALLMGVAISGMHYTGMAAATFVSSPDHGDVTWAVSISALGVAGITIVTLMALAAASVMSMVDRRFWAQSLELHATEARYRSLFDRCLAGVYQTTPDGRLIDCNDAFARILGRSEERRVGKECRSRWSPYH